MKANTRKLLIAGAWACCAAATAHAQATASVISDGEIARKGQSEQSAFKRATSAPELQDQAQRQQAQARATVNSNLANKDATGITVPTTGQLEQESRKQRELHRESLSAANSDAISQIRNTLPRLSDLGGQLKYGNHFVVSRNGQTIIGLIRATSSTQGQDLSTTLKQIEDHAHAGAPEAIHFLGFASENGLFGAPKSIQKAIGFYREAANSKYQPSRRSAFSNSRRKRTAVAWASSSCSHPAISLGRSLEDSSTFATTDNLHCANARKRLDSCISQITSAPMANQP
jgi:TPR repeat protein